MKKSVEQKVVDVFTNSKTIKFNTRGLFQCVDFDEGFTVDVAAKSPTKYSSSYHIDNFEKALKTIERRLSKIMGTPVSLYGSSVSGISVLFS